MIYFSGTASETKVPVQDSKYLMMSGTINQFTLALAAVCKLNNWGKIAALYTNAPFYLTLVNALSTFANEKTLSMEKSPLDCSRNESILHTLHWARSTGRGR